MKICKDQDTGKIPLGAYPLIFVLNDGSVICQDCANKSKKMCFEGDIYYEGPTIECDECSDDIESAYGDPDELH